MQQLLIKENGDLQKKLTGREPVQNILWKSRMMKDVLDVISQVAGTSAPVLITGERGTGKEMIARSIHRNSPRHDRRLVKINCAALPDPLLDYELFGYEKGAVKSSETAKTGRLELADGGTLLLDEISELSATLQVKLLRALQENAIEKAGGAEALPVNVRTIAISHQDLWDGIRNQTFRYDLFYRLNVIPIHLSPLRKRKEDIPGVADYYLRKFCDEQQKGEIVLAPETLEILTFYDWPGNLRELINFIERIVVLHDGGIIEKRHLPGSMVKNMQKKLQEKKDPCHGRTLEDVVASFERDLIVKALKDSQGVKARAAKQLGLSRSNLQYKIKKYGI